MHPAELVPIFAGLVWANRSMTLVPESLVTSVSASAGALGPIVTALMHSVSSPTGLILTVTGVLALGYILLNAFQGTQVERERLFVVVVLMFFSMLFWAFFEQAGTSVNNFTDRNVDRVQEERVLTQADVGSTVSLTLTQEQLGYTFEGKPFTMDRLDHAREAKAMDVQWTVAPEHVGMGVGGRAIPASTFQSANPIYIVLFGLIFSALWRELGKRGIDPPAPVKFAMGLGQLGLGFLVLWFGAESADARGMVPVTFLLLGYLLHTTGELCLSPVGLSMVTKLSPKRLVSTVMGAWFLATAFSNLLAAVIASFTGVEHGGGEEAGIPVPLETVDVYGAVFFQIGVAACASAVVLLLLSPVLTKFMHRDQALEQGAAAH